MSEYDGGFTETQLKALAIIPTIICPMSLVGSVIVIYMIYLRGERRLYHHLMFMISAIDACTSFVGMFSSVPVPESTGVIWARGNTATCELQGFFAQLSISTMMYNMFLMLSFVKIVRYGAKEDALSTRYEGFVHFLSLGYPIGTGIAAIVLDVFNPAANMGFLRCYFAAYPPYCDAEDSSREEECTRGENYLDYLVFFTLIPVFLCLAVMFGSIFLILSTIRTNDKRSRRLSSHNVLNANRAISVQAMIYGIFFFNTYVWLVIGSTVETFLLPSKNGDSGGAQDAFRVIIRFVGETFYGWQGFFNFLIYIRPRYVQIRKLRSDQSWWWAFREAIVGVKLEHPRYQQTKMTAFVAQSNTFVAGLAPTARGGGEIPESPAVVAAPEMNNTYADDATTGAFSSINMISPSLQLLEGDSGNGDRDDSPPNNVPSRVCQSR